MFNGNVALTALEVYIFLNIDSAVGFLRPVRGKSPRPPTDQKSPTLSTKLPPPPETKVKAK